MSAPLYHGANAPGKVGEGHHGLWYDRFFNGYLPGWKPTSEKASKDAWAKAKTDWIKGAATRTGVPNSCEAAVQGTGSVKLSRNLLIKQLKSESLAISESSRPAPMKALFPRCLKQRQGLVG